MKRVAVRIDGRVAYLDHEQFKFKDLLPFFRYHSTGYGYTRAYQAYAASKKKYLKKGYSSERASKKAQKHGWDGYRVLLNDDGRTYAQLFRAIKDEIETKTKYRFEIKEEDTKPVFFHRKRKLTSDRKYQNECVDAMIESTPLGGGLVLSATGCLIGDTHIDIPRDLKKHPDGIKIKNLVGKKPWLYSFDLDKQRVVLAKASHVVKSGIKIPVYKVTFKVAGFKSRWGGRKVELLNYLIGTSDHPVLLRENNKAAGRGSSKKDYSGYKYKKIKDLKEGDRVMPLFRGYPDGYEEGYTKIHLNNGHSVREHRFILSELYGEKNNTWHGHHRDENRFNNSIKNLKWKRKAKHHSDHARNRNLYGNFGWQNTSGVHPRGMKGKKQTKKHAEAVKKYYNNRYCEKEKIDKWRRKSVLVDLFCRRGLTGDAIAKKFNVNRNSIYRALKRNGVFRENNHIVERVEFYGYEDVYDICVPSTGNFVANGVFVHNTGKTYEAGMYFKQLDGKGVFIVDELALLNQTRRELSRVMGEKVGIIGNQKFKPKRITAATIQSLHKHRSKPEFKKWGLGIDVTFIDELHKALNKRNFTVVSLIRSGAVFGLTATLSLKKSHVRLRAYSLCGPVIFSYPLKQGVEEGFLTRGEVIAIPHKHSFEKRKGLKGYNYDYIEHIVENYRRNKKIINLVKKLWKEKKYIILLVTRIRHLKYLSRKLSKIPHERIYGKVKGNIRIEKVGEFDKGDFRLMIANVVFSKGIDIKRVDAMVDAAAMKNENDCLQKYGRGVRLHPDKSKLKYYDISDRDNRFEAAARKRIRVFKRSGIKVIENA